mmetsp:Transcript_11263/g.15881  ORF Transcript_11263/g.15881 Transcript_11263/m.15881 type:complete len:800 (+) Transcript_11263:117-2516(+)
MNVHTIGMLLNRYHHVSRSDKSIDCTKISRKKAKRRFRSRFNSSEKFKFQESVFLTEQYPCQQYLLEKKKCIRILPLRLLSRHIWISFRLIYIVIQVIILSDTGMITTERMMMAHALSICNSSPLINSSRRLTLSFTPSLSMEMRISRNKASSLSIYGRNIETSLSRIQWGDARDCSGFCSNSSCSKDFCNPTIGKRYFSGNTFSHKYLTRCFAMKANNSHSNITSSKINNVKFPNNMGTEEDERTTPNYSDDNYDINNDDWRKNPILSDTYILPTVSVPADRVHSLLNSGSGNGGGGILVPFLASHIADFDHIHPRIKLVRDVPKSPLSSDQKGRNESTDNNKRRTLNKCIPKKLVLLDPSRVLSLSRNQKEYRNKHNREHQENHLTEAVGSKETIQQQTNQQEHIHQQLCQSFPLMDENTIETLASYSILPGPNFTISIPYHRQTPNHILSKLLPSSAHPPPTGYEQIGHVLHLNLKKRHIPHRHLIGSVLLDRLSPRIRTVVHKVGEVGGPYRTYDMEVVAGEDDTNVSLVEDGLMINFDLRKVYWSTRLSGERTRLLKDCIRDGDVVADAFCGVGAFCVRAAVEKGCVVYANDLNHSAVLYCRDNASKNGIAVMPSNSVAIGSNFDTISHERESETTFKVVCGDAFDFIQNLGSLPTSPDHLIMNFPLAAADFLGALRWWPTSLRSGENAKSLSKRTRVHLYTFARADEGNASSANGNTKSRDAMEVAVDLVAEGLIPEGGATEKTKFRRSFLNDLGCNVVTREVRDVAPGKVVIYVSFDVSRSLVRFMQGDFMV